MRFILLAPERIVKMPRAEEVMKTTIPRGFEKIIVTNKRSVKMKRDRYW
jgi:hypothetical protein